MAERAAYSNNSFYFCEAKITKNIDIRIMKKIFNVLLVLCVVGLLVICWRSIQDDIDFQKEVTVRENAVFTRPQLLPVRLRDVRWARGRASRKRS